MKVPIHKESKIEGAIQLAITLVKKKSRLCYNQIKSIKERMDYQ